MALQIIPAIDIEIDIPDLVINEITLKRKAKLFTLTYNQYAQSLTLTWVVRYPDLHGLKGLNTYVKESVADNTTMVDAITGAIILPTQVPVNDEQGNPVLDSEGNPVTESKIVYDGDYVGQYDWFNNVGETQQVNVHDLIKQYGLQAEWN